MDFTQVYRGRSATLSPDGNLLLASSDGRIVVRNTKTFQIIHTWSLDIDSSAPAPVGAQHRHLPSGQDSNTNNSVQCAWSHDSRYVLAARGNMVLVFDATNEDWNASIQVGMEGLTRALWAPDGRTILCFSEWALRVTVWSLTTGRSTYIQFPKFAGRGYSFSPNGQYFILAERHKSRDTIGVYDVREEYKMLRHFGLPTSSLASFALSPVGDRLALWDGPLEYTLHMINLSGQVLGTFTPEPDPGQGIRCVAWHPSGRLVAVGGWDDKFHVLDVLTCRPIVSFDLRARLGGDVALWREPAGWLETTHGRGLISYDRISTPTSIKVRTSGGPNGSTTGGVLQMEWNTAGSLLLVRWDHCAEAVHVYEFPEAPREFRPRLRTVIEHRAAIRNARWEGAKGESIGMCAGGGAVYVWRDSNADWVGDEEIAECIGIPAKNFATLDAQWGPDGRSLVLQDRDTFACAFVVDE
ncbi:WD repeat-containing protein 8 [Clavulina sp. PMI_390]|nr:WD repeat-containing protein 8 [Clavulina sp. PMI_390]